MFSGAALLANATSASGVIMYSLSGGYFELCPCAWAACILAKNSTSPAIFFFISIVSLPNRITFASTIAALDGAKLCTQAAVAKNSERTSSACAQARQQLRTRRASGGLCCERYTAGRTPGVSQVATMHRLVQGQHKEALPVRSELSLPSLGRRLGRLVEIGLGQRLQNVQVPFAQLKILLSNLSEGWIGAGIGDGFRVLAKVLLPLCRGVFFCEECRWNYALNQREMPEDPERVAPAVRRRKRRCSVAHLVDYTEHHSVRNAQCKFNGVFHVHCLFSLNCPSCSVIRLWGDRGYAALQHSSGGLGDDDSGRR